MKKETFLFFIYISPEQIDNINTITELSPKCVLCLKKAENRDLISIRGSSTNKRIPFYSYLDAKNYSLNKNIENPILIFTQKCENQILNNYIDKYYNSILLDSKKVYFYGNSFLQPKTGVEVYPEDVWNTFFYIYNGDEIQDIFFEGRVLYEILKSHQPSDQEKSEIERQLRSLGYIQ